MSVSFAAQVRRCSNFSERVLERSAGGLQDGLEGADVGVIGYALGDVLVGRIARGDVRVQVTYNAARVVCEGVLQACGRVAVRAQECWTEVRLGGAERA